MAPNRRTKLRTARGLDALVADLAAVDPASKADYEKGGAQVLESQKPLDAKIAEMRRKDAGQPVIASGPTLGRLNALDGAAK